MLAEEQLIALIVDWGGRKGPSLISSSATRNGGSYETKHITLSNALQMM